MAWPFSWGGGSKAEADGSEVPATAELERVLAGTLLAVGVPIAALLLALLGRTIELIHVALVAVLTVVLIDASGVRREVSVGRQAHQPRPIIAGGQLKCLPNRLDCF